MPIDTLSRDPARDPGDAGLPGPIRSTSRVRLWLLIASLVFLAAHLPWLGSTLDDIDAFNFALGARQFDPTRHQPHPPGSPLYIYLAKAATGVLDAVRPEPPGSPVAPQRNAAEALSFWSAAGGALALFFLPYLFLRLTRDDARRSPPGSAAGVAIAATALTITCPLFWFSSARPLSDVLGLAAALGAQTLILAAYERCGEARRGRLLVLAAFVTALIIGLRSQTMWLTVPLLGAVVVARWRAISRRDLALAGMAFAAGTLIWAVPLLVASGGVRSYLAALGSQGAEDFNGVDMLYRNPTPRRFALGLLHTFVWPWLSAPLAVVVLLLAAVGTARAAWRAPRVLALGLVAFLPYSLFHLAFQETVTTRYALPLVPAVAWLAAFGAFAVARRLAWPLLLAVCVSGIALVHPALVEYRSSGSPAARLITDLVEEAATRSETPLLVMHQRIEMDTRRAFGWMLEQRRIRWDHVRPAPRDEMWDVLRYWQDGGTASVWFLANPARTDLALIDPHSVREVGRYRWPFSAQALAGNTRPKEAIWYELRDPGWYLGEGWALTPEIGGRSAGLGRGPSQGGIDAQVRRREGAVTLLIGGRNLGRAGEGSAHVEVAFDGRTLFSEDVLPGFFARLVPLPPGALAGSAGFGTLRVEAAGGPPVAIEQFDVQDIGEVVFAFGPGWHEREYNPVEQRLWRWTSDRAELIVHHGGRDVMVEVSGQAGGRLLEGPHTITLQAGRQELGRMEARGPFTIRARVAAAVLERAGGTIALTTNRTFVPRQRGESADPRKLGLRVFRATVTH